MNDLPKEKKDIADRSMQIMKTVMSWVVVIILSVFGSFSLYRFFNVHKTEGDFWLTLIKEHFPVVVGVPMAALAALFITLVLKIAGGPIEFEVAGLKFKGGAAPIVFWIFCFLSITISIKMLWQ